MVAGVLALLSLEMNSSSGVGISRVADSDTSSQYYALVDSADRRLQIQQWASAEELLIKALRLEPANPGNTLLFSNLGVAQMQQGKNPEALRSFALALTRAPKSTVILTHRARLFLSEGRVEEAEEDLGSVLAIDSVNEWALQTRGLLRLQTVLSGDSARFSDFDNLRKFHSDNPWGWFGAGVEAEEAGCRNEAEQYYRKSLDKRREPETVFRLAMLLIGDDRLPEGMELLRKSLKEFPDDGNLYAAMGWAHKKSYQKEESEADLKLAIQYGASAELVEWIKENGVGERRAMRLGGKNK